MNVVEEYLEIFGQKFNFPVDQLRTLLCLLIAYPAAFLHKSLPNPTVKHIYSAVLGFGFGLFCFGWTQMLLPLGMAIPIYLLTLTRVPKMPVIAFLYCLGFLSFTHIHRMIVDYAGWSMDITGSLMLLTVKLTSYAYNIADGRASKISPDQEKFAIKHTPSIIEFLGFTFFFGGFVAGPSFEFQVYRKFTTLETFKNNNYHIPSTLIPALKKFAFASVVMAVLMVAKAFAPIDQMKTAEFCEETGFLYKCFFIYASITTARFPYYFAWTIAEGGCIAAGLGYTEVNGKVSWDGVSNVNIIALETSQSFKVIVDNWNTNTGNWLRRYVYDRVTPPGTKPTMFATVATYMTSAFWHGFYPGYYFTFFSGALVTELGRKIRKNIRPLFLKEDGKTGKPTKIIYDILGWFSSIFILNYICAAFVLLTFERTVRFYTSVYFFGHIGIVLALVLFTLYEKQLPKPSKKPVTANGSTPIASAASSESLKQE